MSNPKQQPQYTFEQQRQMLLTPCKTRKELKRWIKYHLDLELPDVTVSRYSDTNPLDVVWEVYRICVLRQNPDNIQELLFVAGRGSGKCVKKGTQILTDVGLKPIEDVKVNDIVFTGWDWQPVKEFFDEGIKDGIEISTRVSSMCGTQSLTGSLKHRVQAINEIGTLDWVYMKDLKPGQYIYRSAAKHFEVDKDSRGFKEGWILGNIVGDGHVQLDAKYSRITVCGSDLDQLSYLAKLINNFWGISAHIKKNSKNSWNYIFYSKKMCDWFAGLVSGHLAYDKKLITLKHNPNFLAGFISGLMETDGSKDSICLANRVLIDQIGIILSVFGIVSSINTKRRKDSTSKFTTNVVQYASCEYKMPLHEYLMPLFSKREKFKVYAQKMNEQHRFPSSILREIGSYIKDKYKASNGWMTLNNQRIRVNIPFAKELWGKSKDKHTYGYKIKAISNWLRNLKDEKADYLDFILNGYFEMIDEVKPVTAYFYDLEIEKTHSYWSNGFISHNTLGMAIAELMILLHDARDVVHVGAIQNQAERCYAYQKNFLYNRKLKPVVEPVGIPAEQRILEKANMSNSLFNIGHDKVTLEVIPCTLKACLTADSIAETVDGAAQPLVEFKKGDFIKSPQGWTEVVDNTLEYEECLRVELEDGRVIEGTLTHKVMTNEGWVMLRDLDSSHDIL